MHRPAVRRNLFQDPEVQGQNNVMIIVPQLVTVGFVSQGNHMSSSWDKHPSSHVPGVQSRGEGEDLVMIGVTEFSLSQLYAIDSSWIQTFIKFLQIKAQNHLLKTDTEPAKFAAAKKNLGAGSDATQDQIPCTMISTDDVGFFFSSAPPTTIKAWNIIEYKLEYQNLKLTVSPFSVTNLEQA